VIRHLKPGNFPLENGILDVERHRRRRRSQPDIIILIFQEHLAVLPDERVRVVNVALVGGIGGIHRCRQVLDGAVQRVQTGRGKREHRFVNARSGFAENRKHARVVGESPVDRTAQKPHLTGRAGHGAYIQRRIGGTGRVDHNSLGKPR